MSDPNSTKPSLGESEKSTKEDSATKNEPDETPNEEVPQSTPVVPNSFAILQTLFKSIQRPASEGINENRPDLSSIFAPGASPEDMLAGLTSIFGKLQEAQMQIPEIWKTEIPTASLPTFMSGADRPNTNGPTYRPAESNESMVNLLGTVRQAFTLLDRIKDGVTNPNRPPTGAAPPGTSYIPPSPNPFGTILEAISRPLQAVPRNDSGVIGQTPILPPQFDSRTAMLSGVTRAYQTNETILRTSIQSISRQLELMPEDDSNYPLLQSVLGLSFLHLYEATWDDDLLDAGLGGTALALDKLLQLPKFGLGKSAPTVVRCWAYGQRLLVQRDGDVDKLQAAVSILKSCWDIYKDFEALEARVKMFLRTELGMCLLDQYKSTGSLDDLNSSIEHLKALYEEDDGAAPVTVALGMAYYDRFLHCGDIDDLDRALNQGQRACTFGINAPISTSARLSAPSYDTDAAAGHHLFSLGLSERFKMTLEVEDLDKAVRQCKKAIGYLHPSHTLLPPYKASLGCILYARYEATKEVEDLRSAMQAIQSAVEGGKGITGRHLRVPLEAIQGYLTVMSVGAEVGNISAIEDGIRIITKSRKHFSGAAHIESRIETYLSKSLLYLYRITDNGDDFESGLHHAILAFEKAPEESPYRHQAGLDMGKLMLEQYQTGRTTDFDEALVQFCTIALSSTWPSIRLDAAIQWANAIEKTDPEAALDALNTALEILPSLASLGERMSTQYRILSHQKSTIPQRAAICAIDASDMAMAVSCLEKGRNIMWAQSLQLRAGHMLPAGGERKHEFKVLAQYLLSQRQGLPRSPEAFEEMIRHFPPDHMNRVSPILDDIVGPLMSIYAENKKALIRMGGAERVERELSSQREFRENFMEVYRNASLHGSAKRWNTLLEEFNELQGALSFDSNTRKELVPILKNGSIVVVNTYKARCEGVIISAHGEAVDFERIPFPDLSEDKIYAWAKGLRDGMCDLSGGKVTLSAYENDFLIPVLRDLWKGLGHPLLTHFSRSGSSDAKRRVWWYPTGPLMFLPIHAASPCDGNEPGLLEHLISSYIPSIHSLVRASRAPPLPFKVLAVGQPETPGHSRLTYAEKEIGALKRQLRDSPDSITTLIGEEAKIYPVISSVSEYTALQISCHATQNEQYPFDSAFYLHDGPLKLSKIMGVDLSCIQFAFLSACLTSAGDASLPDECIHLAAGMQFAGVGSVIGTMWSVEDRISAAMSTQVYKYLLRNGVMKVDMKESAEALHKAIQVIKSSGIPLTYIVPFIHSGI